MQLQLACLRQQTCNGADVTRLQWAYCIPAATNNQLLVVFVFLPIQYESHRAKLWKVLDQTLNHALQTGGDVIR